MGGKSGIQIIDDINPLHDEGATGQQVNNLANSVNGLGSSFANGVNHTLDADKGFWTALAALFGGAYLISGAGGGAAAGSATASAGSAATAGADYVALDSGSYLFGTGVGEAAGGAGYLGADTSLGSYLGTETAFGSTGAGAAATGYLGVDTSLTSALTAETPWWASAGSKALEVGGDVGKSVLMQMLLGGGSKAPTVAGTAAQPGFAGGNTTISLPGIGTSGGGSGSQFVPSYSTTAGSPSIFQGNTGMYLALGAVGLLALLVAQRATR